MESLDDKLEIAKQRKQSIQMQKRLAKEQAEIEHFKKHTAYRQDVFRNNIELYELYQEEQRQNIKVIRMIHSFCCVI